MDILIFTACIFAIPLALFAYFKYLEKKHAFNFGKAKKPKPVTNPLLAKKQAANHPLNDASDSKDFSTDLLETESSNVLQLTPSPANKRRRVKEFLPEQKPPHYIIRLACKDDRQLSGASILQSLYRHKLIEQEGIYVRQRNGRDWYYVMNSEKPPALPKHPKETGEFRTSALMVFYSIPVENEDQNRVWADMIQFCQRLSEDLNLELRDENNKHMSMNKINQYGRLINHFFPRRNNQ